MNGHRVLILGGTAEARSLAALLHDAGIDAVSSLAGRVKNPALPVGEVRVGGFGGVDGLVSWLRANECTAVVDATHPFARVISANAAQAAAVVELPLLTLRRAAWEARPGDTWIEVDDMGGAARAVAEMAAVRDDLRVFLTTGRQDVDAFKAVDDAWFLIRLVDPPEREGPRHSTTIRSRGPYTLDGELALMREHGIDVIVTKNSGGQLVRAKLDAAQELSLPVIMVRRPSTVGGPRVHTAAEAAHWVAGLAE
ncbi:cobalt-precorrin-6A reductase [Williamsia sp. 1135]|uniref:cobalt-precorrin-6A reductase n=1 Tax=Williamsia sp. 1135 TaxID=1889262 RepID=UPI000A101B15|nr:cobalt-precorrin-6A reductase [Williamsia sp. 1135]ORM24170.1 cobalt-precorrin-6A reductase [Williamsia sp. 1135]